jgi:hypothetical protein
MRLIWTVVATAIVLAVLLWPVQAIVVLMLLATSVLTIDLYGRWEHRHVVGGRQRRSLHRAMSGFTFAFLAAGLTAAVLWPTPMVFITVAIVVVACVLWCVVSSVVWLIAMEHDLTGTQAHASRPDEQAAVAHLARRPRPAKPIAPLPRPHEFRVDPSRRRRPGRPTTV